MKKLFAQKIHQEDVESCKQWLCDTSPINVRQGLYAILSNNNSCSLLEQLQIRHFESKLIGKQKFAESVITVEYGIVTLDDIVTIEGNFNTPDIQDYHIRSHPKFVKLIYQYMSCFPDALYEAYKKVTGENLILDDLSEVREFYKNCASFDSWTAHQLCSYISHCDPEALDFLSANPEAQNSLSKTPERYLPARLSRIFSRSDLYEDNVPLVKAAIQAGAIELIHFDRDNWMQSTLKPQKGLEWAQRKGINYHPVLNEYLLILDIAPTPAISSAYTTPYLEMMKEVIQELEISRENQGKKEAIAAIFEQKLADHKATPSSQKLADAMATLVRLPESQQGRAKYKG